MADVVVSRCALPPGTNQYDALCQWVDELVTARTRLLDIGAGDGDDDYAGRLKELVGRYVGVDPDPATAHNAVLDDWYEGTIEAYAAEVGEPFDVALAIYVVEHVADPVAFLTAARRCLEPGGSLFVLTPNLWHYFAPLSWLTARLHIDGQVLRWLRAARPETHDAAHFPTSYRMNSVTAFTKHARRAGFVQVDVRHLDDPGIFEAYFPGRLVTLPRGYSRLVRRLALAGTYGTLLCRLVANGDSLSASPSSSARPS
ncbi:MAG TPA: methyltransferase domain-containing protein [Acidimicrobiales bacterium]|nr:methyltransferase domain-containing protein [Acidimicrobiales bacterium]